VVIDNFVRSGICMVKTVEPLPAAPANGAAVGFGKSSDGQVLGVSGGAPAWAAPDPFPIRSSRPNSTDRLVEVLDGVAWMSVHYDSGWRDVTALLQPGWTATHIHMRREGDTVRMRVAGLAAPGEEFYFISPPEGFRTAMSYYIVFGCLTFQVAQESGYLSMVAPGGAKLPAGGSFWYELDWATPDPFPASLPGTTLTTAP
jgi:hypothetical protein